MLGVLLTSMKLLQAKYNSEKDDIAIVLDFVFIKIFIRLYTNAFASYGIFIAEIYFLARVRRPDFGYADQPPLSVFILGINRIIFGDHEIFKMHRFVLSFKFGIYDLAGMQIN